MAPGQWNGKNFGGCHTGNGKKQKTGHYFNNGIHHRVQSHLCFKPGMTVVEKKTGYPFTVLEKNNKGPRSLIRVKDNIDGEIKYIRTNLLHTEDRIEKEQKRQLYKYMTFENKSNKKPFVKNNDIIEFRKAKCDFREQLKEDKHYEYGGGVSINYKNDPKGKYYISAKSKSNMINEFNEKNLEIMNYIYDNINDPKKMAVREKFIPRSKLLQISMLDQSGSSPYLVPNCNTKEDYYNIVNKYMNENKKDKEDNEDNEDNIKKEVVSEKKKVKKGPSKFTDESRNESRNCSWCK